MLKWSEKFELLTKKGMSWKDIQEMDRGLDDESNEDPTPDPTPEPTPEPTPDPTPEPTEKEKELLSKIEELENKLKNAQSDNVHGNNETEPVSFDEQLNEMFKDVRI